MVGVSAVVLTKNEVGNISYCLDSLQWCDEIIVVDSNSEDGTIAIAEEYGAKVVQEDSSDGRFDHLRNFGVEKASNDWIFVLDADEICPEPLAETLLEEAERDRYEAFNIPRRNFLMDERKLSAIWPDYQMRFHKADSVDYDKDLHKFIDLDENAYSKDLDPESVEPILHFGIQSVSDLFRDMNRYTSITAKQDAKQGYSIFKVFFASLWDTCYSFGRNFLYKKGYRKPYQTALIVFSSAVSKFMIEFKKWQLAEKGSDEEVLERINDIRKREIEKYDEGDFQ